MNPKDVLVIKNREDWRRWLRDNSTVYKEVWLEMRKKGEVVIDYLEAVEEALCFGWIDGMVKRTDSESTIQRFTPRRAGSHWTELNKERVRRLRMLGKMDITGLRVVPDIDKAYVYPSDLIEEIKKDKAVWDNFLKMPDLYKRIRLSNIDESRKDQQEFKRKLDKFIDMTKINKMYGGRLD